MAAAALVLDGGEDELLVGVEEVLHGLGGERGRPPHPLRKIYPVSHNPDRFSGSLEPLPFGGSSRSEIHTTPVR